MVCLSECVQEAEVSDKAEAHSYQATVRPGLAGCLDPRVMVARRGGSCPAKAASPVIAVPRNRIVNDSANKNNQC
jgi:hypothetical protein